MSDTSFIPGSFGVRLGICIVGVAVLAALWSWRLRRKYAGGDEDDEVDEAELAMA